MADPFLGEIRLFTFSFAPRGWARCDGQLLPIQSNQALFSLLGTTYGGNGTSNFALPDLRSRVAVGVGGSLGFVEGQRVGAEAHTLLVSELPSHTHLASGSTLAATSTNPANQIPARAATNPYRSNPVNVVAMDASSNTAAGGSQAHENRQPFTTLNFCIALQGIFPPRF